MKTCKRGFVGLLILMIMSFCSLVFAQEAEEPAISAAMEDGGGGIVMIIWLATMILTIIGSWKILEKAGKPGWAVLVPIYNIVVFVQVAGRPVWWILLLLVPLINFVVMIVLCIDLAKRFGKGVGYGLGLLILSPIFFPMLGFSDAKYTPLEKTA